jgi:TolB protein
VFAWNQRKVRQLTTREIGLVILGRGVAGGVRVLACALAVACGEPAAPGAAAGHQFLMLSHPEGSQADIYRVNADGTARVRLTFDGGRNGPYGAMSLSPDGLRFTYIEGCSIIWVMNVDGTEARPLTTYASRCNRYPRWSPDGRYIAFQTTREGHYSIYVMNADGSDQHNVSLSADSVASIIYPFGWSPDGLIVFMHDSGGSVLSTYTVKPDGTGQRRLFEQPGDHTPKWSPDRSRIAFLRETEAGSILHVMNADGSNVRRLTNHAGSDDLTRDYLSENDQSYWSPDGRYLVFYRLTNVGSELHVIRADGSGELNLSANGDGGDRFNGWSPDGRITLQRKGPSGTTDIFLVHPDGTGLIDLTNSPTYDFNALWLLE